MKLAYRISQFSVAYSDGHTRDESNHPRACCCFTHQPICGEFRVSWRAIDASCGCCQGVLSTKVGGRSADEGVRGFPMLRNIRTMVLTRQPIHLVDALHHTRSSLATDPRDKIFALLGLAFDGKHFVPEPTYMGSVSDSFTEFATSLIESHEPLDFIYLRSTTRGVMDGKLPSWVPDWTDLNDPVAHRQFDYITALSLHSAADLIACGGAEFSVSGHELNARCVLFDTADGLGSAFTSNTADTAAHETAMVQGDGAPYDSDDEISSIVRQNLMSTELFPNVRYETSCNLLDRDLYRFWSAKTRPNREEMSVAIPAILSDAVRVWLAENRSFAVHGRTVEWWTKAWSSSRAEHDSSRDARNFFNAIQSGMRLLVTERGYFGWTHPQARRGDKIVMIFGCSRPVILRTGSDGGNRIVGDECLSGKWAEDLATVRGEDLRIL